MAAINPGTFTSDTAYGQQFRQGGQIVVLPFVTSGAAADTWQAPTAGNPVSVAWQPAATTDHVAVTMDAAKLVTFSNSGAVRTGNLILVMGGAS